jgi:hypothetical protein
MAPLRERLDSASTMAPDSNVLSMTESPVMPMPDIEMEEPFFKLFPTAGGEAGVALEHPIEYLLPELPMELPLFAQGFGLGPDPMSRVPSPAYKQRRCGSWDETKQNATYCGGAPPMGGAETKQQSHGTPGTPGATMMRQLSAPFPATPPEALRTPLEKVVIMADENTPPGCIPKARYPRAGTLLQALEKNSEEAVRTFLQNSPADSAREPLWHHGCEPPLCAAVRLKCSAGIVKLLLEYGADPDMTDTRGRNPGEILRQSPPPTNNEPMWSQSNLGIPQLNDAPNWLQMPGTLTEPLPDFPIFPDFFTLPGLPEFGMLETCTEEHEAWSQEVSVLLEV